MNLNLTVGCIGDSTMKHSVGYYIPFKLGRFLKSTIYLTVVTATLLPAQKVLAAEAADQPYAIEEIVVTARKRSEPLQKVPISVAAFTAADINARSVNTLTDIAQFTPNLDMGNQGQNGKSATLMYIRGIGQTDVNITNDPGVGVYVDGVYLGRMQGLDFEMMDIQRIEVLRGPQGTLFGKNTIGGAINVITEMPNFDSGGKIKLTTGSFNRIDALASLNIPVVQDKLAVKLTLSTDNQDGYGHSLASGQQFGNTKSDSGRGTILFKPTENLEIISTTDVTRIREDADPFKVLAINTQAPLVGLLNSLINPPYDNRWLTNGYYSNYSTGPDFNNADIWGTSLSINWNAGPVYVKSITSYRKNNTSIGVDFDGSPIDMVSQITSIDSHQFTQEFQIGGTSFNNHLKWVSGIYYFSEKATESETDVIYAPLRAIGVDASFVYDTGISNKAYAAYGQGTYSLTDKLNFTAGLRSTYETKDGDVFHYGQYSGLTLLPFLTNSDHWSSFSPRIGLDYKWTPDVMTYVSAAQGFKSGGFNGLATSTDAFTSYKPETVWTFEAGLRSEWFDKRLRFNATAYYSLYNDIQFTIIQGTAQGAPTTTVGNAAKAAIKGGELELVAVPLPGLTLSGGLGLIDAKYTSVDPSAAPLTTASQFVDTPKWSATASAEYDLRILERFDLAARLDYAYKSTIYHDVANSPVGTQAAYGLVNGRLTFATQDKTWSIAAFGTNLTNRHYLLSGIDFLPSLGLASVEYAPPREWGLNLEYHY